MNSSKEIEGTQNPSPLRGRGSASCTSKGEGATRAETTKKRRKREVSQLTNFARQNRKTPTLAEKLLWSRLRNQRNGISFRRQHVIGNYIVDFFCSPAKLLIEIDGASHDETETYDTARTAWLESEGFTVIRLWNMDVINDTDACATALFTLAEDLIDTLPFPRFNFARSEKPPHPCSQDSQTLSPRGEGDSHHAPLQHRRHRNPATPVTPQPRNTVTP